MRVQGGISLQNFYPRSPRGERHPAQWDRSPTRRHFYPRSPRGERRRPCRGTSTKRHFYPRSPRGERLLLLHELYTCSNISIHAPREGSDPRRLLPSPAISNFYPRSPRGERHTDNLPMLPGSHFYPRSPRGERHSSSDRCLAIKLFLSTLPARGATPPARSHSLTPPPFLSTLPARGATASVARTSTHSGISIHAPREGSDDTDNLPMLPGTHFYPRSPRGERPGRCSSSYVSVIFLSTLPARGATARQALYLSTSHYFYPRSPRGERPTLPSMFHA